MTDLQIDEHAAQSITDYEPGIDGILTILLHMPAFKIDWRYGFKPAPEEFIHSASLANTRALDVLWNIPRQIETLASILNEPSYAIPQDQREILLNLIGDLATLSSTLQELHSICTDVITVSHFPPAYARGAA